jgi:LacI family gluconate utilization system Gnt-I transcriptional repressor
MHLLDQRARRIRFVKTGMPEDFRAQQRSLGYARAMEEHGLKADVETPEQTDPFKTGADHGATRPL